MHRRILFGVVAALALLAAALPPAADAAMTIKLPFVRGYEWHAGDDFVAAIDPAGSPAVAAAPSGTTVEVEAFGALSLMPKAASGQGTYVLRDADGAVVGGGRLEVVGLVTFRSYGDASPQGLPPVFEGGIATLRVLLRPAGGGEPVGGTLTVDCALGKAPPGHGTGVRLSIEDDANYNRKVSGATLFIRLS